MLNVVRLTKPVVEVQTTKKAIVAILMRFVVTATAVTLFAKHVRVVLA
jgi:hypothetical protein